MQGGASRRTGGTAGPRTACALAGKTVLVFTEIRALPDSARSQTAHTFGQSTKWSFSRTYGGGLAVSFRATLRRESGQFPFTLVKSVYKVPRPCTGV